MYLTMQHYVNAEFVLYAAKFDEASEVRFHLHNNLGCSLSFDSDVSCRSEKATSASQVICSNTGNACCLPCILLSVAETLLFCFSLQVMLQSDIVASDKVCYLFRRLIYLAEAKTSVLDWLGQFIQLSGSLDLHLAEDDVEWLVAKSWNIVSVAFLMFPQRVGS